MFCTLRFIFLFFSFLTTNKQNNVSHALAAFCVCVAATAAAHSTQHTLPYVMHVFTARSALALTTYTLVYFFPDRKFFGLFFLFFPSIADLGFPLQTQTQTQTA